MQNRQSCDTKLPILTHKGNYQHSILHIKPRIKTHRHTSHCYGHLSSDKRHRFRNNIEVIYSLHWCTNKMIYLRIGILYKKVQNNWGQNGNTGGKAFAN